MALTATLRWPIQVHERARLFLRPNTELQMTPRAGVCSGPNAVSGHTSLTGFGIGLFASVECAALPVLTVVEHLETGELQVTLAHGAAPAYSAEEVLEQLAPLGWELAPLVPGEPFLNAEAY